MDEHGEMEIKVTESERDILYETLSDEYQEAHAGYLKAVQEWYAHPNDGTDDNCCIWSERMTDIENLLTKLGFEVDQKRTTVRYRAMA